MTLEGHVIPPVTSEVLALPLRTGELVRQALDLLTRQDSGLRRASLYVGLIFLGTIAPCVVILWLTMFDPRDSGEASAWAAWLLPAMIVAGIGWLEAAVYARGLATVVIGGRVEGRPLRMPESLAIVRRRFWRLFGAGALVGLVGGAVGFAASATILLALGPVEMLDMGVSLALSLLVTTPFVYVPAAILLGEVEVFEAIRRSWRLVRLRPGLAIVSGMFGVFSQFIVLFGMSSGADIAWRLIDGSGLSDGFPPLLTLPVSAALVFAFGTLFLLVEAVSASAAVHAFEALTHFTGGLELGRAFPAPGGRIWQPWLNRGLVVLVILAWLTLAAALAAYPW